MEIDKSFFEIGKIKLVDRCQNNVILSIICRYQVPRNRNKIKCQRKICDFFWLLESIENRWIENCNLWTFQSQSLIIFLTPATGHICRTSKYYRIQQKGILKNVVELFNTTQFCIQANVCDLKMTHLLWFWMQLWHLACRL